MSNDQVALDASPVGGAIFLLRSEPTHPIVYADVVVEIKGGVICGPVELPDPRFRIVDTADPPKLWHPPGMLVPLYDKAPSASVFQTKVTISPDMAVKPVELHTDILGLAYDQWAHLTSDERNANIKNPEFAFIKEFYVDCTKEYTTRYNALCSAKLGVKNECLIPALKDQNDLTLESDPRGVNLRSFFSQHSRFRSKEMVKMVHDKLGKDIVETGVPRVQIGTVADRYVPFNVNAIFARWFITDNPLRTNKMVDAIHPVDAASQTTPHSSPILRRALSKLQHDIQHGQDVVTDGELAFKITPSPLVSNPDGQTLHVMFMHIPRDRQHAKGETREQYDARSRIDMSKDQRVTLTAVVMTTAAYNIFFAQNAKRLEAEIAKLPSTDELAVAEGVLTEAQKAHIKYIENEFIARDYARTCRLVSAIRKAVFPKPEELRTAQFSMCVGKLAADPKKNKLPSSLWKSVPFASIEGLLPPIPVPVSPVKAAKPTVVAVIPASPPKPLPPPNVPPKSPMRPTAAVAATLAAAAAAPVPPKSPMRSQMTLRPAKSPLPAAAQPPKSPLMRPQIATAAATALDAPAHSVKRKLDLNGVGTAAAMATEAAPATAAAAAAEASTAKRAKTAASPMPVCSAVSDAAHAEVARIRAPAAAAVEQQAGDGPSKFVLRTEFDQLKADMKKISDAITASAKARSDAYDTIGASVKELAANVAGVNTDMAAKYAPIKEVEDRKTDVGKCFDAVTSEKDHADKTYLKKTDAVVAIGEAVHGLGVFIIESIKESAEECALHKKVTTQKALNVAMKKHEEWVRADAGAKTKTAATRFEDAGPL